jgi:hypothetical protein
VYGASRVPFPPARITARMNRLYTAYSSGE